jgi:transposase
MGVARIAPRRRLNPSRRPLIRDSAQLLQQEAVHEPRVEQLIEAAGAELRYLPPYSPDMNPIEKAYSKLKAFLRKISKRTVSGLMNALETCAHIFKPAECVNYFKACGYDTE